MSELESLVVKVDNVEHHPDADRLDIITIGGYLCIANRLEDGSSRYETGQLVVYLPEQAVLPEWLMKDMNFWNINKDKPEFKYIKSKKIRGIFSQGILYPVDKLGEQYYIVEPTNLEIHVGQNSAKKHLFVNEGDDVSEFLGITKYEPKVPESMSGRMTGEYISYTSRVSRVDFDSIQKQMNMFEDGEEVWVQEKVHGTQCIITWVKELNDPLLFGTKGNIFVTSKGVSKNGFVYKNFPENADNIYVKMLMELLDDGLEDKFLFMDKTFEEVYKQELKTLTIYGEIIGIGIQDLGYGLTKPKFRLFDISINNEKVDIEAFYGMNDLCLHLDTVPLLYQGEFSMDKMIELRDGMDTITGSNIREGIVIRALGLTPRRNRKIAKFVSPAYLLRKDGTEYN